MFIDDKSKALKILSAIHDILEEKQAEEIVLIDVSDQSAEFEYFVVATGKSETQLATMAKAVKTALSPFGDEYKILHKEGKCSSKDDSAWVLLDCGLILIHLFSENAREYYSLERVWNDGQIITLCSVCSSHDDVENALLLR